MAQLDSASVRQLKVQLDALQARCTQIDSEIKQTENRHFSFEAHQFPTASLTLMGYLKQIEQTLNSLQTSINKKRSELLIKIECDQFVIQFQLLLQLVQAIENGNASSLYNTYSSPKEKIYQQLKKQSEYEHRLLAMIAEQEELLINDQCADTAYIKEKLAALKVRFHKCNSFTQKLEFQLEELDNE